MTSRIALGTLCKAQPDCNGNSDNFSGCCNCIHTVGFVVKFLSVSNSNDVPDGSSVGSRISLNTLLIILYLESHFISFCSLFTIRPLLLEVTT